MNSLKLVNCKPIIDFKKLNFEVQVILILNCSDENCLKIIHEKNINTALFLNDSKIMMDLVFKSFSELNNLLMKLHYSGMRCTYYILMDKLSAIRNESKLVIDEKVNKREVKNERKI